MACVFVLSMLFAFASCNKVSENPKQTTNTTSAEKTENTTDEGTTSSDVTASAVTEENLEGAWAYDEIVSPKVFYSDFYNPEITQTNIELRTTYEFNNDGTFSISVDIVNISDVRREYRSLMVAAGRTNLEAQGKMLTTDDVLYYEGYADKVLEGICTTQNGTYAVEGNKLVYTLDGESFYETFTLNNDKLTLTGSSVSEEGYPVAMTKM